jgi:hypothetical protein
MIGSARAAIQPLVTVFRAVTRYAGRHPFHGRFWSSAHEAAVEAASDLLSRVAPACGDPVQGIEDRVIAELQRDVEQEHAAAVASYFTQPHAGAQPPTPPQTAGGVITFGDLLASVRGVEQAAAQARSVAESMNDAPGTTWWRMQAGVFEATAEYKGHPAFSPLEAYVNLHHGEFSYVNLLRVRGALCESRQCGTAEADRMTVEQVVLALGCPGVQAETAPPPAGGVVETPPTGSPGNRVNQSLEPIQRSSLAATGLKRERGEGGRRKLGEGPKAKPERRALRNVYDLIRAERRRHPRWGPTKLKNHFSKDKDFRLLVERADKKFGIALFRSALAWIKEHDRQESPSGIDS